MGQVEGLQYFVPIVRECGDIPFGTQPKDVTGERPGSIVLETAPRYRAYLWFEHRDEKLAVSS